eukprot:GILJ01008046.1.p1 GENE.GILJ01008046.1~~GILJ01008046.1.p1  ORF type:complete len:450 (+),score=33.22 GILJ01008046.1:1083-2432(+)
MALVENLLMARVNEGEMQMTTMEDLRSVVVATEDVNLELLREERQRKKAQRKQQAVGLTEPLEKLKMEMESKLHYRLPTFLSNSPIAIHEEATHRGRYYVAQCDIPPGQQVLHAVPYVASVFENWRTRTCAHCFASAHKSPYKLQCSKCKQLSYCSEGCRLVDCSIHQLECPILTQLSKTRGIRLDRDDMNSLRLLIRVWSQKRLDEGTSISLITNGESIPDPDFLQGAGSRVRLTYINDMLPLVSNLNELLKNKRIPSKARNLHRALSILCSDQTIFDLDEILLLLCQKECNAFGLWDPADRGLGEGFYPTASYFNHSCYPNCVRKQVGRHLEFISLRFIAAGEPLTICYVDVDKQKYERRGILQDTYCFRCACERCTDSAFDAKVTEMACHRHGRTGLFVPDTAQQIQYNKADGDRILQPETQRKVDCEVSRIMYRVCNVCDYKEPV